MFLRPEAEKHIPNIRSIRNVQISPLQIAVPRGLQMEIPW